MLRVPDWDVLEANREALKRERREAEELKEIVRFLELRDFPYWLLTAATEYYRKAEYNFQKLLQKACEAESCALKLLDEAATAGQRAAKRRIAEESLRARSMADAELAKAERRAKRLAREAKKDLKYGIRQGWNLTGTEPHPSDFLCELGFA